MQTDQKSKMDLYNVSFDKNSLYVIHKKHQNKK